MSVAPGLQPLLCTCQFYITQEFDVIDPLTEIYGENVYRILYSCGRFFYTAVEESSKWGRECCCRHRTFDMRILDRCNRQVLRMHRPCACACWWWPCCYHSIDIIDASENFIGCIEQEWTMWRPSFRVDDVEGPVMRIKGHSHSYTAYTDGQFDILTLTDQKIGAIGKHYPRSLCECPCSSEYFRVEFPLNLHVNLKAILIGACFLIEFIYFK